MHLLGALAGHVAERSAQTLCKLPWAPHSSVSERIAQNTILAFEVLAGLIHPAPYVDRYFLLEWKGPTVRDDRNAVGSGEQGGEDVHVVYYRFESYMCGVMLFRLFNIWWYLCAIASTHTHHAAQANAHQASRPTHEPLAGMAQRAAGVSLRLAFRSSPLTVITSGAVITLTMALYLFRLGEGPAYQPHSSSLGAQLLVRLPLPRLRLLRLRLLSAAAHVLPDSMGGGCMARRETRLHSILVPSPCAPRPRKSTH